MDSINDIDKYTRIFINVMFQMENLESLGKVEIPSRLKSIRTAMVFIQRYDAEFKAHRVK